MNAFRGDLTVLTIVADGDKTAFADLVSKAAEAPGEWEVDIRKPRMKRSDDANKYAWVLIDKLAQKLRMSKLEVYRNVIREIPGVSEIVCIRQDAAAYMRKVWEERGIGWQTEEMPSKLPGCVNLVLYYGSSVYDTVQMSALIDELVRECKDQHIETMSPEELARLEGYRDKAV